MKSLILTCLYLFKDTLHRWKERPASPVSRMLVTFFLSLCALSFLANYVLSSKMIRDEIRSNGADLILVFDTVKTGDFSKSRLIQEDLPKIADCDILCLKSSAAGAAKVGPNMYMSIVEYDMHSSRMLQELSGGDQALLLMYHPSKSSIHPGPTRITIGDFDFSLEARPMPEGHILSKLYPTGVILIPEHAFDFGIVAEQESSRYVIKVKEMTAENISRIEETLNNIVRYDGSMTVVQTYVDLLKRLEILMSNQMECRAGFSIGIAVVVGILLTALASMEFRQNEYVYTLLKSFGVRPIFLVINFVVENVFLVGISFAGAVWAFMKAQKIVLGEFFKLGQATLSYQDIEGDLYLLAASLMICVAFSTIPIIFSAYRPIGKVLK